VGGRNDLGLSERQLSVLLPGQGDRQAFSGSEEVAHDDLHMRTGMRIVWTIG